MSENVELDCKATRSNAINGATRFKQMLLRRIDARTSWGSVQLKALIAEVTEEFLTAVATD